MSQTIRHTYKGANAVMLEGRMIYKKIIGNKFKGKSMDTIRTESQQSIRAT